MHFDPRPGVQSAVGGANIFVCLSVGVCALCPVICVSACVCAIMRRAIHGWEPVQMLTIQYQPQPQKRQHTYMDQVTDPEQGFDADSAWNFFQEACGMFPKEHTSPFVSLARVFCPYLTIAPAWKRFPGATNKSNSVSRLSFEMVLAEGRRSVISQFSC